ncbi:RNA polymerase sigma factor [Vitiosangium sp. GDMCC 1.1324]|uniref:RNA polymerase sigma factor n=1 Tax=Vitiosangium sp. (strain GDMCC 1.1324) TaxID=2138576 RepID=UPI000D38C0DB|nr:RNA polymerase sigma factor [Vitiosangium sp. GDMCC 1.1324]PTL77726.1 RNA polymerase sigma factor [Vitiosangium sp. GDMCC 1.1324]
MDTMQEVGARLAGMGSPSDEELARRVREGETALFEVLMRRHNARVYRAVRALLSDEAEVEDVMQQAYVLAFTHLGQFKGMAKFSTWLIRIAVNEALLRLRKRSRLVALDGGADEEQEAAMKWVERNSPDPERETSERELVQLLESTIDALPAAYRMVLMLREVDGLSTAETAEVLSVSEEVVRTRLHRARAMLRDALDARLGGQLEEVFSFQAPRCDRVVAAVFSRIGMH